MVIKRRVARAQLEIEPWLVWNEFVNLVALEDYEDLDPIQRPAHLCFWYESEVQNGGHMQYFENPAGRRAGETIPALLLVGANSQARVLEQAVQKRLSRPRLKIQTVEDYCEEALEGEFSQFDTEFSKCSPTLNEVMEKYLSAHQGSFIELT